MHRRHVSDNMTHVQDGEEHVALAALHVLVAPSVDGGYFAQGIEIDYTATGRTDVEARTNFQRGFMQTVEAYVRRGLDLGKLYTHSRTPGEFVEAYFAAKNKDVFGCCITMKLDLDAQVNMPRTLAFVQSSHAVAA